MGDAMVGLLPNLHCRPREMRLPVGVVVVLVGVKIFSRVGGHQAAALVVGAVGAFQRVGLDDFRAVKPHQLFALLRGVGGQEERHLVPQRRPQRRVGDAGVAAGRVDDGLVGGELAARDAVQNHRFGGAVLHRTRRVEILRLGAQLHAVQFAPDGAQAQQRRVPDRVEQFCPQSRCHGANPRWIATILVM